MRKYIVFLFVVLLITGCKTTPEDYSKYPFIDQGIKSDRYEVVTLMNEEDVLTNVYGYYIPFGRVVDEKSDSEKIKRIMAMPFLFFNSPNELYFTIDSKKMKSNYLIKYKIKENKVDSLQKFSGDDYSIWQGMLEQFYKKQRSSFIDFKFPAAEKYYKILDKEYHSEISEEKKNKLLEEYKNETDHFKERIIENMSLRYNTIYSEIQMPQEKIQFKFNNFSNKEIEFFGNEEQYKKGYIYIYIISNKTPHSGGLYVIRPKEKK